MKVLDLLEEFKEMVDATSNFPMTKKILLERDEVESLIKNVQTFIPDEMQHARWITGEREKILSDAQKEAEEILLEAKKNERMILAEAQAQFESMVNESEVLKEAEERAAEVLSDAKNAAREVRMSSYQYSEDMLLELKDSLERKLNDVNEDFSQLQEFLQQ